MKHSPLNVLPKSAVIPEENKTKIWQYSKPLNKA